MQAATHASSYVCRVRVTDSDCEWLPPQLSRETRRLDEESPFTLRGRPAKATQPVRLERSVDVARRMSTEGPIMCVTKASFEHDPCHALSPVYHSSVRRSCRSFPAPADRRPSPTSCSSHTLRLTSYPPLSNSPSGDSDLQSQTSPATSPAHVDDVPNIPAVLRMRACAHCTEQ